MWARFKMTAMIKTLLLLGVVALATCTAEQDINDVLVFDDIDEDDAATIQCSGCKATLYDQVNYGGRSVVVTDQDADLANSFFKNRVESIKIAGTCSYLFYEGENFNNPKSKSADTHLLRPGSYSSPQAWGSQGNMISSARALPPAGTKAIAVFEHQHYSGPMAVLRASQPSLSSIEFNNKISSEIVIGGKWTLYGNNQYSGVSVTRTTGQYPIEDHLRDRVSSIKYIPPPPPAPPPPPPPSRRGRWRWGKK